MKTRNFDGSFCIIFLSIRAFSSMSTDFYRLIRFRAKRGENGGKLNYVQYGKNFEFHFSTDFDGFLSKWFLLQNATTVTLTIFCSITVLYFLYKMAQRVTKCDFAGDKKILFFIYFWCCFFLSFDSFQLELSVVCRQILFSS